MYESIPVFAFVTSSFEENAFNIISVAILDFFAICFDNYFANHLSVAAIE
jgi:hypothetical protein